MKRLVLFIGIFALFTACEEEKIVPAGVLERSEFVKVLTDVQLLEAAYNQKYLRENGVDSIMLPRYLEIFGKYNTEQEQFAQSFEYYRSDQEDMRDIYEEVLNALNVIEEELR